MIKIYAFILKLAVPEQGLEIKAFLFYSMENLKFLRQGNYINVFMHSYGQIIDYDICEINRVCSDYLFINGHLNKIYPINIYPISINHNNLIYLGFHKKSMEGLTFFKKNGYLIRYYNGKYELLEGKRIIKILTSIHRLQNLWYELTDQELIYDVNNSKLSLKLT